MAHFIRHIACPACGSSDANSLYSDNGQSCFSCNYKVIGDELRSKLNDKHGSRKSKVKEKTMSKPEQAIVETPKSTKAVITEEQIADIKEETGFNSGDYRGILDSTYKKFGVRHSFFESGEIAEQYYPVTQSGELVGYKVRELPKSFGKSIGRTGSDCDLFMQFKFKQPGKYVVITEGEIDALSAYQMIKNYNVSKGWDYETAVVSPTVGARSAKQIGAQYKFFDQFDKIIISYDNDTAGQSAIEDIVKVLPKGKVYVMQMRLKDANEYLKSGNETGFISEFYNAKKYVPVNVLPSSQLYERVLAQSAVAKIPFPPFMGELNEMFVGGLPLGHIINIAADTGIGKTTFINEMIYYWIFNSPHKIGIVSMELDAGQYGEALLSRHLSKKLALIKDQSEKMQFLHSDEVKAKAVELTVDAEGEDRFDLLDNRDGSVEEIQDTVEELVISCGAKLIVLDPLQDVLDGLSNEEQAMFMKWAKGFVKSHGVTFVFINHMRKTPAGQNGADSEQNIMGSSTIIKSASANILLKRDKMAEDPVVRNTTEISVTKNRVCGITGPAGGMYYDNETHTLHNFQEWMDNHGQVDF